MQIISVNRIDHNPSNIDYIARYLDTKLKKYQMAVCLPQDDGSMLFAPSAVRGNSAYAFQRRERYAEYQRAIDTLSQIDPIKCTTNAFFITLTFENHIIRQNPPQIFILTLRRRLKTKKVQGKSHTDRRIDREGLYPSPWRDYHRPTPAILSP